MLYIQAIQIADDAMEIDNQSRIYGDKYMHEWRKLSFYVLAWSSFTKSSAGMEMTMKDKSAHAFHDRRDIVSTCVMPVSRYDRKCK